MARTFQKTKRTGEDVQNTSKFAGVMSRREGNRELRQQKALQQNQDKPKPGTVIEQWIHIAESDYKTTYLKVKIYITKQGDSPSSVLQKYPMGSDYYKELEKFYELNTSSEAERIRKFFRENYDIPEYHDFKDTTYSPPYELYYFPKMKEQEGMGYFWNMEPGGPIILDVEEKKITKPRDPITPIGLDDPKRVVINHLINIDPNAISDLDGLLGAKIPLNVLDKLAKEYKGNQDKVHHILKYYWDLRTKGRKKIVEGDALAEYQLYISRHKVIRQDEFGMSVYKESDYKDLYVKKYDKKDKTHYLPRALVQDGKILKEKMVPIIGDELKMFRKR